MFQKVLQSLTSLGVFGDPHSVRAYVTKDGPCCLYSKLNLIGLRRQFKLITCCQAKLCVLLHFIIRWVSFDEFCTVQQPLITVYWLALLNVMPTIESCLPWRLESYFRVLRIGHYSFPPRVSFLSELIGSHSQVGKVWSTLFSENNMINTMTRWEIHGHCNSRGRYAALLCSGPMCDFLLILFSLISAVIRRKD